MTIAIGALYQGGIIISADTNVICSDGSRQQTRKVEATCNGDGCFAIANASEDGNAAKTLVSHLIADLLANPVNSWAYLESLVADRMTHWAGAFQTPPSVQLVLGARLNDGSGLALYFCEPPNTVVREPSGYLAVGAGASITNPLHQVLFSSCPKTARTKLIQIAYLMYRAKKESALCGGRTISVVIGLEPSTPPQWVMVPGMQKAEAAGPTLDYLLRLTCDAAIPESNDDAEAMSQRLATGTFQLGRVFRELEFQSSQGKL